MDFRDCQWFLEKKFIYLATHALTQLNTVTKQTNTHSRVQVAQSVHITPVLWWMLIGLLEATMVVLNDGIKQIGKHGVSLRIWRVDTDSRVMVLETCTAQTGPNLKLYKHPNISKLKIGVIHLNAIKIPSNVLMIKVVTVLDK